MKIPFLGLFRKATGRLPKASPKQGTHGSSGARRVEKPSEQKLSKTVLPNTTRSSTATDPFKTASSAPSIKMASASGPAISLKRDLPPAVRLAMQPRIERSISLELSDVLEQMPAGYVKSSGAIDGSRHILLKASEIEKGMAEGKPTVSLATIYEQVPEIFLHTVPSADTTHVSLPYGKVLEQFNKAQVRADQVSDHAVPQVETPILQVTMEDKERFGTAMVPPQTSVLPPVKVEPATAKTISTAEPEAAVREKVAPVHPTPRAIPLSTPVIKTPEPAASPQAEPAAPTRIPFYVPPNGMGASASERVPASSGPPIPTGAPKKPTSARIPFRVSPPCDDLRPKLTLVPGLEAAGESPPSEESPAPPSGSKPEKIKVSLALQVVMQNLPAFQLKGTPQVIPSDVRVEFPLALVEPQLATGRVAVEAKAFRATLPEPYREFFVVDSSETPVLLPLQEVLKNLPTTALKLRDDQEEIDVTASFETPFSIKAKEDEQRFNVSAGPVAKPVETPDEKIVPEAANEEKRVEEAAPAKIEMPDAKATGALAKWMEAGVAHSTKETASADTPENSEASKEPSPAEPEPAPTLDIKGRKEKNEAKEVVARANTLPGVTGCSLTFADGLGLAGNLPAEAAADGLSAMAPSLLQRIEKHMLDTKLGSLTAMTLHCTKSAVTFFMQGNICLTVLHTDGNLPSETENELAKMTKELSRTYSQPETANVDH
jgi:predicted regulator of Ras-like GTPase activity (Roadblock/LC7/MglB family)